MSKKVSAWKRITVVAAAMVCTMAVSMTAFAKPSDEKDTDAYGKLKGTINSSGYLTVSIETNPDRANLTLGGTQVAKTGETVVTQQNLKTPTRGTRFFDAQWNRIDPRAYTLFGAHGVQDGTQYSADAIYTSTGVNR